MVQTQRTNAVQWVSLVLVGLLCLALLFNTGNVLRVQEQQDIVIPTAEEIAALVIIPEIVIPEIEQADTFFSVRDDKDALAEELAVTHLDDSDFLEELAEELLELCGLDEDFDEDSIQSIEVSDVEIDGSGNDRDVLITAKVLFDDDGDDEKIKLDIGMNVEDLDRDDDYEDAEVAEGNYSFEVIKNYNDFCEQ